MWNPAQYGKYADHRSRPFYELLSRVDADQPRLIYDLGCGSGELTATLAARWPDATVIGVDKDAAMLASAANNATDRLSFIEGDLASYLPPPDTDVVVSNAAYQWIEGNVAQLRAIATRLKPSGWLALQVPGNFQAPSHRVIRELVGEPRWQQATGQLQLREDPVLDAAGYGELFASAGLQVDTWETTYNQVLPGADPVLEWVKGTAIRPVLDVLSPPLQAEFIDELRPRLRKAYPPGVAGTVFAFRRIFAVAHRAGG